MAAAVARPPPAPTRWQPIGTHVRWCPLTEAEIPKGEIHRSTSTVDSNSKHNDKYSISISHPKPTSSQRPWESAHAFRRVFEQADNNVTVFDSVVAQAIPKVLQGASCNFFAYGHTGSGKTHTIVGYENERADRRGLCLAAAKRLFEELEELNLGVDESSRDRSGVGFSLFELRKNVAYDLLNGRTQCHIRQGADGKTHVRGETEMLEDGKVRVRPIVKVPCWSYEMLKEKLEESLDLRAVGTSSKHDLSSRTHAVLELEVVNIALVEAREALYDRQSELVPVGKHAADVVIEEAIASMIKNDDGTWRNNPNRPKNQARVDAAQADQDEHEARVAAAEERINHMLESPEMPACLGAKLVFVDLAGSEYQTESRSTNSFLAKQTPQERQEGRQINTDLLALKEVIRACSSNQPRIPFRSSPLTMVLREHFLGSKNGESAMIVTVSPSTEQYAATVNSLKYGSLVGAAGA